MALKYRIDIENSSGTLQGSGPITSATHWESTAEMDRAGDFSFAMPATDSKSSLLTRRNVARCYALINDTWTEIGAGVIDSITMDVSPEGEVLYNVSGMGIMRELTDRSVRNLELASAGTFITHSAAITAIDAYSPAGWTITAAASPPNDNVYGRFAGESVLHALLRVAEKTRTHFYYNGDRTLLFADSFADSGVRAIQADADVGANTAAILSLRQTVETFDLVTRIIPYGAGQGDTRLTLAAANRTPATGYTLDTSNNYLENDTATSTYGVVERAIEFKDIGPVSNSDADVQAASNALYDAAYEWLRRYSEPVEFYELALAECDTVLRPMQTIRVNFRDVLQNVSIDTDLNILAATIRVDAEGLRTTHLTVATQDRWPEDDAKVLVGRLQEGKVYQALPQLNANSYTTAYRVNIDDTETATARFRFGAEVTQLQQVLFEFQLLPFESTVKTVALDSMTGGAGELETDPAASEMGAISNNSSGTSTPNETGGASATGTGSASPLTGQAAPATGTGGASETGSASAGDTGSAAPATGSEAPPTGEASPDTSGEAPNTGSASPATGSKSPNTGSTTTTVGSGGGSDTGYKAPDTGSEAPSTGSEAPNTGSTGSNPDTGNASPATGGAAPETGAAQGEVEGDGRHFHDINFFLTTTTSGHSPLYIDGAGTVKYYAGSGTSPIVGNTLSTNDHTHDVDSHTHTTAVHTHTTATHNHTTAAHTHTTAPHTHTTASHSHTTQLHNHTTAAHTHTTAAHTHSTVAHTHTTTSHSHTTVEHNHIVNDHTHTTAAHSHTTASHTHTSALHAHTTQLHTHTTAGHTHTTAAHSHTIAHTHDLNNHTHSLNDHQHTMTPSITTTYGIFREEAANTYGIDDLEYQVNSNGWSDLNGATDIGSSWYRLDLTSDLRVANTYRPVQESNTLQIRKKAAAADDKTVTVDALLSVRNIIQGIAYA